MRLLPTTMDHALATDPAQPHAFKAPPDDWALFATGGSSGPGLGALHVRVAQPRAGHPPRCRVLGCARTPDDPIHDVR